ncbi:hypothetical protein Xszus_02489 [Xenorhabdus szentirmaii]|nr:hypothetical protein Xsze_00393 [Xenorhabdus szentirmaii DSM 16338]PHM42745.1 hypothetical protein Xszus_02489 [Xenorhabdus szentirmaii]
MRKYMAIALCSSYFLFVPMQASALFCSPYQADAQWWACIGKCHEDNPFIPAWLCAEL